jgi:hypothetical protein
VTNWRSHKVSQTSRKNGCIWVPVRVLLLEADNCGVAKRKTWMRHETLPALQYWNTCSLNCQGKRQALSRYSGTSNFENNPFQETVRLSICSTFELNFPIRNNANWIIRSRPPKFTQYKHFKCLFQNIIMIKKVYLISIIENFYI